jgi:hypothetical protein
MLPFKRDRGGFRKRKDREGDKKRETERDKESIRINRLTFRVF